MFQPFVCCIASVRFFRGTELHTGDGSYIDEKSVGDVAHKIAYWLSHRLCGGVKLKKKLVRDKKVRRGVSRVSGVPPPPSYRQPATSWVHYTTSCNTESSAPEDGRDQRPKHVELIGVINKPLLLHLVDVYIIYNLGL